MILFMYSSYPDLTHMIAPSNTVIDYVTN